MDFALHVGGCHFLSAYALLLYLNHECLLPLHEVLHVELTIVINPEVVIFLRAERLIHSLLPFFIELFF